MNQRVVQFRVGVMVLATIIIIGILIMLFGEMPAWSRKTYPITMKFAQATGVSKDTPVRKSGILIGRVRNVQFDEQNGGVLVTADLSSDITIHRNEEPHISTALLGDTELQFVQAEGQPRSHEPIGPGDVIQGHVAEDPLRSLSTLEPQVTRTMESLTKAGDEITHLARNLNNVLGNNDEQLGRIVNKTEKALDSFQSTINKINDIVGDDQTRNDLKTSAAQLPKLLGETAEALGGIQRTMTLADQNLQNLQRFTQPLGDRGEAMVLNIDRSFGRLDSLLTQLDSFSRALNSREGTLGQLINDPQLYNQVNTALANVNELAYELKPVIRDARVFTDKIARHPESLGVRGAIQPSSGIK